MEETFKIKNVIDFIAYNGKTKNFPSFDFEKIITRYKSFKCFSNKFFYWI